MPDNERTEEYLKFRTAMEQIVTVPKADIVSGLPKMFRERKAAKKTTRRKRAATKKPS